jgi:hypothetical protein
MLGGRGAGIAIGFGSVLADPILRFGKIAEFVIAIAKRAQATFKEPAPGAFLVLIGKLGQHRRKAAIGVDKATFSVVVLVQANRLKLKAHRRHPF